MPVPVRTPQTTPRQEPSRHRRGRSGRASWTDAIMTNALSFALESEVARTLAALSTREIVAALGLEQRGTILAASAALVAHAPSLRLGRRLARFDSRVKEVGLPGAAKEALA